MSIKTDERLEDKALAHRVCRTSRGGVSGKLIETRNAGLQ